MFSDILLPVATTRCQERKGPRDKLQCLLTTFVNSNLFRNLSPQIFLVADPAWSLPIQFPSACCCYKYVTRRGTFSLLLQFAPHFTRFKMSPSKSIDISFTEFFNVVDGKNVGSKNIHNGINPATQEKLWDVPIANQQDVDDAVESALKAFKSWSQTPIEKRKEYMNKFVDLYSGYQEEFTTLMCKETGKPKQFAQGEVAGVIDMFKHHASLDLPTETFENDERSVTTSYVPLGVVGAICPWNFPLLLAVGKIAPAVLTGMLLHPLTCNPGSLTSQQAAQSSSRQVE